MLVAHVTEATGSLCLQGETGEKEAGDKCVVWANCCLVDIKSSLMVGVVCADENPTWSGQPLQMGVGVQLYQLSSGNQHHPKMRTPARPIPSSRPELSLLTVNPPHMLVCTAVWDKLEISRIVKLTFTSEQARRKRVNCPEPTAGPSQSTAHTPLCICGSLQVKPAKQMTNVFEEQRKAET